MNEILKGFLERGVINYIDDIRIYSRSVAEHRVLVGKVWEQLREYEMAISLETSIFHVKLVDVLGYVVVMDGVTMNDKKVRNIKA